MELQIRFCKTSDGIQIAYATLGLGSPIVFCPGWVSHLQLNWETPGGQAFLEPLARSHTVIVYDRPGSGLSERKRTDFSLESEIRPLQAVVDHLKLKRFILFGYSQGGAISALYSTLYPRRVTHLILYDSFGRGRDMMSEELLTAYNTFAKTDWVIGSKLMADLFVPAPEASDRLQQLVAEKMRECMNQDVAVPFQDFAYQLDVTDSLPKVRVPTLVMHRRGDRIVPFELGRKVAASIPGSQFIQLEGSLHPPWLGDVGSIVRAISEFLGDPVDAPPIAKAVGKKFVRKLTAILSADVKGYSRLMGEDEEWTVRTLNAYKEVMASLIQQHHGRVVDAPGDNVLAEFASVVDAVRCAVEIQKELKTRNAELPENRRMEFRIGVNLGDVIEDGEQILGDGVNIAARLENLSDAGGICISGTAFDQVDNKLSLGYEYLGEQAVKNIAKPVRVYRVLMEPETSVSAVSKWKKAFPLPDKPSIAVLPFVNMSEDPKQEFFSDGMTEEIITALSRSPDLFVIARTSTFVYKGKSVDVKRVGEELGVHYVLEGSVRRSGENVRITAQLVDAMTGYHLWADRYDRSLREIFAIQDEITLKIMEAVHVKLEPGENILETGKGAGNLEAFLKFLEAREHFHHWNKEEIAISRKLFEEVIALDQDYAAAYLFLAATNLVDVWLGTSKSSKESVELAIELGEKAIALDASVAAFQAFLANSYIMARQFEKAVTLAENALALRQDSSEVLFWAANVISWSGKPEEAIPLYQRSIRLNPFAPGYYFQAFSLTYRLAGRYSEGLEQAKKAVERDPKNPITHIALVASYILVGREEKARVAAADVLRINPNFSVEQYVRGLPLKDQLQAERYIEALRKAGLK